MQAHSHKQDFSIQLEKWFQKNRSKTIGDLLEFFGEKSFAILFLHFMFIPALPIPTGGITTIVLIPSVVIASLQMIFGRRALWLPKKAGAMRINGNILSKAIPFMIRRIRWLEKFSKPRQSHLFKNPVFRTMIGIVVLVFALASLIAPPFSGFDTLPSMGVVIIALSIILDDFLFTIVGIIVGAFGIGVLVTAASAVSLFIQKIL